MPAEREAQEPVPRAAKRVWPWARDVSLVTKFREGARAERLARYRRGRFSELIAAAALMARGYRILARRCRTPYGEIDLIAVRRRRLAFVEVKRRATQLEAEASVSARQAGRIARAAEYWISRHPRYHDYDRGLDAVFVLPGRLPVHLPDALNRAPQIGTIPR